MAVIKLLLLCSVYWLYHGVCCSDVVLLDTRNATSELKWTTFTNARHMDDAGWLEETWQPKGTNENRRAYVACNVDRPDVDNWLRTPYIEAKSASRLYVEVMFTVRDCKLFPGRAHSCKETFKLLAYQADYDFASERTPAWDEANWETVDSIAADSGRFMEQTNEAAPNLESRGIAIRKKGVYFAFRDTGACISILNVKIFYRQCDGNKRQFAFFKDTPTGAETSAIVERTGRCVPNSSPVGTPTYVCKADGKWDLPVGSCQCNPGYEAVVEKQTCTACAVNTYKADAGLGNCMSCPLNSNALSSGKEECSCDAGFYRSAEETARHGCSQPPTQPRNLRVTDRSQSSVEIEWDEPMHLGGRPELWYRWRCDNCPQNIQANPSTPRLSGRRLVLSGLQYGQYYSVSVFAENDVSSMVESLPQYAIVEFETAELSPLFVTGLKVKDYTDTSLTLAWKPPTIPADYYDAQGNGAVVKSYEILYWANTRGEKGGNKREEVSRMTDSTVFNFNNLTKGVEYAFMVRTHTTKGGYGAWSDVLWAQPGKGAIGSGPGEQTGNDPGVHPMWIALVAAGFVITLLVVVLALYMRKNRNGKQLSDLDHLDNYKQDNMTPDYNHMAYGGIHPTLMRNGKLTSPLMVPYGNGTMQNHGNYPNSSTVYGMANNTLCRMGGDFKPYVDPLAYEDPNQALIEFTNEIDPDTIIIEKVIGGGEFGDVCLGSLRWTDNSRQVVAIKALKPKSGDKAKSDFLAEASIMGQFDHPNVIRLLGVVTRTEPVMILTEYMENHSLDNFLRANDGRLHLMQLVGMLKGIAAGMKYLSEKRYVHRDLAARNVLVDDRLECKIADFGLSRGLEGSVEQAYTTNGGKIPVRWTAPEAITHRKFTAASDVWSYGVVMWEVTSYGERPYWEWTNQKVIEEIQNGFRLPPPMGCPPTLHQLMLQCWRMERRDRPSFTQILRLLETYISSPDTLFQPIAIASPESHTGSSRTSPCSPGLHLSPDRPVPAQYPNNCDGSTPVPPPANSVPPLPSFEEFFRHIGLSHCVQPLSQAGVRSFESLRRLTTVDYYSYGLTQEEAMTIRTALNKYGSATLQRRTFSSANYPIISQQQQQHTLATIPGSRDPHTDGFFV